MQIDFMPLEHGRDLPLPKYETAGSAGMDLMAAVSQTLTLAPGARALLPCGFAMALPSGYEAQVRPRSGLAVRQGLTVLISELPEIVDFDPERALEATAGVVFVLALDPVSGDTIAQATVLAPVNGRYPFTLSNLAPGTYELVAGTDMDGDFFLGDPGEAFGGFPTLDQLEEITVNGEVTGLSFPMVFQFIDAQAASTGLGESGSGGRVQRLRLESTQKQLAP